MLVRFCAVALVLGATFTAWAAIEGQAPGRAATVRSGEPTDAGEFDGTWMYVNRDVHFALWIRTKDGQRQVRVQYQSLASPEGFETDWAGKADYFMAGNPVKFELALDAAEAAEMTARWTWDLQTETSARTEKARVVFHRTGYGRTMSMRFEDYERTIRRGTQNTVVRSPVVWSWTKVSKRELLWDELPW